MVDFECATGVEGWGEVAGHWEEGAGDIVVCAYVGGIDEEDQGECVPQWKNSLPFLKIHLLLSNGQGQHSFLQLGHQGLTNQKHLQQTGSPIGNKVRRRVIFNDEQGLRIHSESDAEDIIGPGVLFIGRCLHP